MNLAREGKGIGWPVRGSNTGTFPDGQDISSQISSIGTEIYW
jgi:hypothetical protein